MTKLILAAGVLAGLAVAYRIGRLLTAVGSDG